MAVWWKCSKLVSEFKQESLEFLIFIYLYFNTCTVRLLLFCTVTNR